jgi:hypothetical protein
VEVAVVVACATNVRLAHVRPSLQFLFSQFELNQDKSVFERLTDNLPDEVRGNVGESGSHFVGNRGKLMYFATSRFVSFAGISKLVKHSGQSLREMCGLA